MDCSDIGKKPWIALSRAQKSFLSKRKSLFASYKKLDDNEDSRTPEKNSESSQEYFLSQNKGDECKDRLKNNYLFDQNHPVLKNNFPLPNPCFAFHQFQTNDMEPKKNIINGFSDQKITAEQFCKKCCCGCSCSSCSTKVNNMRHRNLSKHIVLCDQVDISSMNLTGINVSSFCNETISRKEATLITQASVKQEKIPAYVFVDKLEPSLHLKSQIYSNTKTKKGSQTKSCCVCNLRRLKSHKEVVCLRAGDNLFTSLSQFTPIFSHLKELYLPGNRIYSLIDEKENSSLSTLPNLQILDLSHNFLIYNDVPKHQKVPSSNWLPFFHQLMDDLIAFDPFSLIEINLSFNQRHLDKRSKKGISLSDKTNSFYENPAFFSTYLQSLQTIHLEGNDFSDEDQVLEFLSCSCPNLVHINLMRNNLKTIPILCLEDESSFSSLQKLNLSHNAIYSEVSLIPLTLLENLNRIILSGNPIVLSNSQHTRRSRNNMDSKDESNSNGIWRLLEVAREERVGRGNCPLTVVTEQSFSSNNKSRWDRKGVLSMVNGDTSKQIHKIKYMLPNSTFKDNNEDVKKENIICSTHRNLLSGLESLSSDRCRLRHQVNLLRERENIALLKERNKVIYPRKKNVQQTSIYGLIHLVNKSDRACRMDELEPPTISRVPVSKVIKKRKNTPRG